MSVDTIGYEDGDTEPEPEFPKLSKLPTPATGHELLEVMSCRARCALRIGRAVLEGGSQAVAGTVLPRVMGGLVLGATAIIVAFESAPQDTRLQIVSFVAAGAVGICATHEALRNAFPDTQTLSEKIRTVYDGAVIDNIQDTAETQIRIFQDRFATDQLAADEAVHFSS